MINENIMIEVSLNDLKKISLGILESIHQFCIDNNIKYSLAYGTLIGAVRHTGFIPWDDDIDIIMPRIDYERFIRTYNNGQNVYRVVDISIDDSYPYAFAKVEDSRTIKNELGYDKIGVCIDVFPMDNFPDSIKKGDKHFRAYRRMRNLQDIKNMKWRKGRSWYKNLFLYVSKFLLLGYPLRKMIKESNKISQQYNEAKTNKLFSFVGGSYGRKEIVPNNIFDNIIELEFEGKCFNATANYDELLTILYGDYMQLPPGEKRVTHHNFQAYWKD